MVPLKPIALYKSDDYFRLLPRLISQTKSGGRVLLMSMTFDPEEPNVTPIMSELIAAAKRGVHVDLIIDALAFSLDKHHLPTGPTMLLHGPEASRQLYFKQKYQLLQELCASGGQYHIINGPTKRLSNPYAGRSHIKLAVINDVAFIGGCNLDSAQVDFMMRFKDTKTVNWLYGLAIQIAEGNSAGRALHNTDQEFIVDTQTKIFIDAGVPKQSLIYKTALDFIDSAQEWLVMTCQYFPNATTAKHLAAAVHRGVDVRLYYNHPRHHALHMRPVQHAVIVAEKIHQPSILFAHQLPKDARRFHAKLLASERGAMIGSHNYVTQGVNFGTAEITVQRYDSAFAQNALNILKEYLP